MCGPLPAPLQPPPARPPGLHLRPLFRTLPGRPLKHRGRAIASPCIVVQESHQAPCCFTPRHANAHRVSNRGPPSSKHRLSVACCNSFTSEGSHIIERIHTSGALQELSSPRPRGQPHFAPLVLDRESQSKDKHWQEK